MLKFYLWILFAGFFGLCANAQNKPESADLTDNLFKKFTAPAVDMQQGGFYIAVIQRPACTAAPAIQFIRTLGHHAFIIKAASRTELEQQPCIIKFSPANNSWKLSPQLEQELPAMGKRGGQLLSFTLTATNIKALLDEAAIKNGGMKVLFVQEQVQSAIVKCTLDFLLNQLLPSGFLVFADAVHQPQTEVLLPGYDKSNNGVNTAAFGLPFANGKGVVTGIKERKMNVDDIDLQKRVQPSILAATEVEFHATSIATMIGGAGNSFYTGRGIAPQCDFFPSSFNNIFPDSSNLLLQKNINIQNHSYGTVKQQFYGAEAMAYDVQTFANKNLLHVFSSGNRGTETGAAGAYNGLPGFANMTGNFKMAKNVVTVAALDSNAALAPFSSAGPLYDGRLGPQLTAFGLNGTSDAAALVSGTATILHQVYKDSNAQAVPAASLVKAILFNTADDVGAQGIDYRSGFGSLNVYGAVVAMLKKQYAAAALQQNGTWSNIITLPTQAANLKVTLAWTDTAAAVNNNLALINDLDLELRELATGTIYRPWVLNPAPYVDSLNQLPVRKRDSLNTAEQISINLPNAGQYQILVKGTRVQTQQPQAFHIVWGWDTLHQLMFTNPNQAEDISLEERNTLAIKWKTALANTAATGNLSISYNGGTSWQTIAANVPLNNRQYKWVVKDTVTVARLKMDCPFGTFFSNDFVIAPFTNLKVEFVCADSAGISWRRHPFAMAYRLFALPSDTAYLKPIAILTDTAVTLRNPLLQYDVFAVRPVLGNGLPAAQSLAINIRNQAVGCFYNSLQATNNGATVDLELLLSTTKGVDSVVFQKLNADNSLQRTIGASNVAGQRLDYRFNDAKPQAGLNAYRVRIVFKDGRFVFTNKVLVINTGPQQIYLYPNPVAAGGRINYQLQDANPGWQLQLLDVQGRVLRTLSVGFAGTIRMENLQPGVYIYRLLNESQTMVESGKIIVKN